MKRGKGEHLQYKQVKSSIIEYVLKKKEEVSEPDIRSYLKREHNVEDQSTINKHLHELRKNGCIEIISPVKMGLRNKWNVMELKNLKNIRHEFPDICLNNYEKAINIVLRELEYYNNNPDWIIYYLKLYMSASFFNTCIEMGRRVSNENIWKVYISSQDASRQQLIQDLLKLCYSACVDHFPDFKAPEDKFNGVMYVSSFELCRFSFDHLLSLFREHLPGLPEEIPLQIFETQLSQIEGIPEKIPDRVDGKDLVKYILNTIRLIKEQRQNFEDKKDDLLSEHFAHHDMLIGADSPEELYFINKTKENHTLPRGSRVSGRVILREAELADLELASEMIFRYKQPSIFSLNSVKEIHEVLSKHYKSWQL